MIEIYPVDLDLVDTFMYPRNILPDEEGVPMAQEGDRKASDYFGPEEFASVEDDELEYLGTNREATEGAKPLRGLAISGGGIRSASFGLGVLQALVKHRFLPKVDYLSTVSGGGYIGSSLTWFLNQSDADDRNFGTQPENFPLGGGPAGEKVGNESGNQILNYLRQHGNYLVPGRGLNNTSLLAVALRVIVVSLFIYGGLLTVLMRGFLAGGLFGARPDFGTPSGSTASTPPALSLAAPIGEPAVAGASPVIQTIEQLTRLEAGTISTPVAEIFLNPLLALAAILVVLFAFFSLLYAVFSSFKFGSSPYKVVSSLSLDRSGARYALRTGGQRWFGFLLKGAAATTVLGVLPLVHDYLRHLSSVAELGDLGVGGAAGGSTLIGSVLGVFQARAQQSVSAKSGWMDSLRVYAGAALLLFGFLLGSFVIAESVGTRICIFIGGAALVVGLITNINYLSLHRMYRDRLMETFMPNRSNVASGEWGQATEADEQLIDTVCAKPNKRPYHLINTNVVLVDSTNAKYRGRAGDSFTISRLFCGSEATGWRKSSTYMKRSGRGMTLPTGMAISGAAVNPNTGVAGRGATRSRSVSILMSLLNLRLGYWAPNPRTGSFYVPPNYLRPGLPAVFGRGLREGRGIVELTDGGHFENLGLYELVRRRVGVIVVSDGGCDPEFKFGDLSNAVERVRVDFGVKIRFQDENVDLRGLLPGSAPPEASLSSGEKIQLAQRGFAVGKIHYPADELRGLPKKTGSLYYLKTTLIPELPQDLYGYKLSHEKFPDETTADQFFDENQFEAYRELGYCIGEQLFDSSYGQVLLA